MYENVLEGYFGLVDSILDTFGPHFYTSPTNTEGEFAHIGIDRTTDFSGPICFTEFIEKIKKATLFHV